MTIKIGIIGGSGLDDPKILQDFKELEIDTPYGKPSSSITTGKISGIEVFIIARHGKKHTITPSNVNNRANIAALSKLGCKYIIATSAVGSLKEEIKPGDFVIPDQLIDFTKFRKNSFYESFDKEVVHASLADPFSSELRTRLIDCCSQLGFNFHARGTSITIEGPRFSTRAESNLFRQWNCDVIGMTTSPEAALCREAGLEYAVIAMSTDYDCWKEGEEPVSIEMVFSRMKDNAEKVKKLLVRVIESFTINSTREKDIEFIKTSIRSFPDWPKPGIIFRDITSLMNNPEAMKKVIDIFVERYKDKEIDVVAGIESRGFIFAAILAEKLGVRFVPIRKPGKLPGEKEREEYQLEYGKDAVEIHKDSISPGDRVLVVDDLIATSGTMIAAANLVHKLGGKVEECGVVIELNDLGGRRRLEDKGFKLFSLVNFKETE